jgi:zinc protease
MVSKPQRGKESFAPREVKPVALPAWAEQATQTVQLPKWELSPKDLHLPNGLRLIVLPERISRTVSVFGAVKTQPDLQVPKGQDGVESVMEALFPYGTDTLDRLAFQKELDKIAASMSAGGAFSLKVPSEHFERGLQLLADNLLRPGFPEGAFRVVQEQTVGTVAGLLQSPDYRAARAMETALYPAGDPSLREATPRSVQSLTLEDVKDYHRKTYRPDLTTIVVIGDVEPARAIETAKRYFGEWKNQGPQPPTILPPVPLNLSLIHISEPTRRS